MPIFAILTTTLIPPLMQGELRSHCALALPSRGASACALLRVAAAGLPPWLSLPPLSTGGGGGRTLGVVGCWDGTLRLYEAVSGNQVHVARWHGTSIHAVAGFVGVDAGASATAVTTASDAWDLGALLDVGARGASAASAAGAVLLASGDRSGVTAAWPLGRLP